MNEIDKIKEAYISLQNEVKNRQNAFKKAYKLVEDEDLTDDQVNEEYYEDLISLCEAYHQIRLGKNIQP